MKNIALILLCVLAAWWCILTVWLISCHRERVRAAAKPMTQEELEESKSLEERLPRHHMRPREWAATSPFWVPLVFVMLPLYIYGWLVKDPYKKHDHAV
jgi:hypothetical protein